MKFNVLALDNENEVFASLDKAAYPRDLLCEIKNVDAMCEGDAVVFLRGNADANLFSEIKAAFTARPDAAAFALRNLPGDFCGYINETSLSIVCLENSFVIKSSVITAIGGFDLHMAECLAQDLSKRILAFGYEMFYLPASFVSTPRQVPQLSDYVNKNIGDLLFTLKYAKLRKIFGQFGKYISVIKNPVHYDNVRKALVKYFCKSLPRFLSVFMWRNKSKGTYLAAQKAPLGFDILRAPSYLSAPVISAPKISVLIRTHNRPDSLRETLKSLRNSTYKNYEIVIVEDGDPTAKNMVSTEFADLPINYISTHTPVGRSKAGNFAISAACGEYCNFLDDDDYLYPDHLELMAGYAAIHPKAQLILGCSCVLYADKEDTPFKLSKKKMEILYFDRIDAFTMCQRGQIPIQSACFKKELYHLYGGLDESINSNEDWAMWLKYISHSYRINAHTPDIQRASSVFVLPASIDKAWERKNSFKADEKLLFNSENIRFNVGISDMRDYYYGVLRDVEHMANLGKLDEFLDNAKKIYKQENHLDD